MKMISFCKKGLAGAVLIAVISLISLPAFAYNYDEIAWTPSDKDLNTFNISLFDNEFPTYDLYLYDWGNPDNNLVALDATGPWKSITIEYDEDNTTWVAHYDNWNQAIELGDDSLFGFFFSNDGGITKTGYDFDQMEAGKSYHIVGEGLLPGGGDQEILLVDAAPVLLPGTFVMFAAGILGMLALRSRVMN
ncbi:hypothetical protein [Desulfovulcanus sp.]